MNGGKGPVCELGDDAPDEEGVIEAFALPARRADFAMVRGWVGRAG